MLKKTKLDDGKSDLGQRLAEEQRVKTEGFFCLGWDSREDESQAIVDDEVIVRTRKNAAPVVNPVRRQTVQTENHNAIMCFNSAQGEYVTHLTLASHDGYTCALQLYKVTEDAKATGTVKMLLCDSPSTNTGWENGAMACYEEMIGR